MSAAFAVDVFVIRSLFPGCSNHPAVLGENNCNLVNVVIMFSEVLARNAIDIHSPVGLKIASFLKSLSVSHTGTFAQMNADFMFFQQNTTLFSSCVASLSPAQQQALKQVLV